MSRVQSDLPSARKKATRNKLTGTSTDQMAKRSLDDIDRKLLSLLRNNARTPTAALGRQLSLSRSAVQERLKRLERDGIIAGYTLVVGKDGEAPGVGAHVLLSVDPKAHDQAIGALKKLPEVQSAYTVSGSFDAIAIVSASNAAHLDEILTRIGHLPGVQRTTSSILLSTVVERRA
jgi:DNA-binding Lrp family transcriptional regulator